MDSWDSFLDFSVLVQRAFHRAIAPGPVQGPQAGWRDFLEQERRALEQMPRNADDIPSHIIPPPLPENPDDFVEPGNENRNFGYDDDDELARAIQASLRESGGDVVAPPVDLRTQQDHAYLEGLMEDRRKEERRLEDERRARESEEARELENAIQMSLVEDTERSLKELEAEIPQEPLDTDEGACRLAIRLPSGARLQRCLRSSDTIGTLRKWIKVQRLYVGDAVPLKFSIVMDYPRREFHDDSVTLKDAGMFPRAAIIVHSLEDE